MFSPQIHIVFNCEEDSRITKPIIENPPNKLYYFTAIIRKTNQRDVNMEFYKKNSSILKQKIPTLCIIPKEVDYTNFIEIIQEISKIIKDEREENQNCEIFINVSTGSKMTAIASIEASKLWDCRVYYVFSSEYDPYGGGPMHKGELFIKEPLTFPIKKPEEIYVKTVLIIEELINQKYSKHSYDSKQRKFIYLKKLIQTLSEKKIIELESKHNNPRKQMSALYMKANNFLKSLSKDLEFIAISDDKRNKKVFLTENGNNITKIFKFLI
jgi:hypothetical protein